MKSGVCQSEITIAYYIIDDKCLYIFFFNLQDKCGVALEVLYFYTPSV